MKPHCIAFALLLVLHSCGEQKSAPLDTTHAFTVPAEYDSRPHELIIVDLNNDGQSDALLIVRDSISTIKSCDSVHCFVYQSTQSAYRHQCSFAIDDYDHTQTFRQSSQSSLVVAFFTNTGGTSRVAARGCQLFQFRDSCLTNVMILNDGDPHVEYSDSMAIVVHHDSYSTFFTHEDEIAYVDDVLFIDAPDSTRAYRKQTFFEEIARLQSVSIDSALATLPGSRSGYARCYEATVRRVMALSALNKLHEAKMCIRDTKRRAAKLPQLYRDALDELMEMR